MEVLGSFRLSRREGDVEVQEEVGEDHLDVRGGEEATGACRLSLAEGQTFGPSCRELVAVRLDLGGHSLIVEAETVEGLGVGVDIGISCYGVTRHGDVGSDGEGGAILELQGSGDFAVEGHCPSQSASPKK